MTEYIPQVGDCVQVKGVEQLTDEYGVLGDGSFDTPGFLFVPEMRGLCGEIFHIDRIYMLPYSRTPHLRSVEGIENTRRGDGFWYISAAMVNHVASSVEHELDIDEDAWLSLL